MRVLTWNIHKGIGGVDRRYDLSRTIDVLAAFDADVVMLQEVDEGAKRSRYEKQAALLADALNLNHYAVGLNHKLRGPGWYGNVTLARWPILDHFNLDISFPLKKRRGALYACVDIPGIPVLHTFNFHLGLAGFERLAQVREILSSPRLTVNPAQPAVIAGDSNDWSGKLCEAFGAPHNFTDAASMLNGARARTFPAARPVLALDRVYYRGLKPLELVEPPGNTAAVLARRASDHVPLAVEFSV